MVKCELNSISNLNSGRKEDENMYVSVKSSNKSRPVTELKPNALEQCGDLSTWNYLVNLLQRRIQLTSYADRQCLNFCIFA